MANCFRCGECLTASCYQLTYVDDKGMERTTQTCSEACALEVKAHFVRLHESRVKDTQAATIQHVR